VLESSPKTHTTSGMKFISWNVNGIRACLKKGFADFMKSSQADVYCLQEIKATEEQIPMEELPEDYQYFWYPAERKGYSGTALITRVAPLDVTFGMGEAEYDTEGRVVTAEFDDYFLVTVYTPNAKADLARLKYREEEWDPRFLAHLKKLEETKPVIACGDLNVAHKEIDLARPKENVGNAGFTDEERRGFQNFVDAGFMDTFRLFNSEGGNYSWWSYRAGARQRNIGWRIDYFIASESLEEHLTDAFILPDVLGSDHCPVGLELE